MFRKYHHGHSVALGFLLALAMQRHELTLILLALLAGLVIGRGWATLIRFAYFARRRVLTRAANTQRRVVREPFAATRQSSTIPF